ncbi:hypothetical protein AAG570_007965 [Ranatra chinensis]|uniref:Armadillo repeat-containing protein 6 n=1 Tax=Ranatra chinensis TaxID=642074 RepID=A0ABD0YBZ8_9HEMI
MASKRRNMFQKNKTQETMETVWGILLSIRGRGVTGMLETQQIGIGRPQIPLSLNPCRSRDVNTGTCLSMRIVHRRQQKRGRKMVKVTTQESFDAAVKENMEMFELSYEEALLETIAQFEAQGIDLTNIVKSVAFICGENPITKLFDQINQSSTQEETICYLKELTEVFKRDMAHKIMAGKCGAYAILLEKIKRHEDNKAIVRAVVEALTVLMDDLIEDRQSLYFILHTISSLIVRNEHCETMANEGGLENIRNCLDKYFDDKKMHQKAFKVLSALAGNDDVKAKIIQSGVGPYIASSLSLNSDSLKFCIAASHLIGVLCLRNNKNSQTLFDLGCAEWIVQNMKRYNVSCDLQVVSCRALRNMVSHNPEIKEELVKQSIEDVLQDTLLQHEECSEQIKFLLRELGCNIVLKEPWTGEKGDKLK